MKKLPYYEFHPLANIFPLMDKDGIYQLGKDILEHGQQEPIVLFEGKILDGRNRYRAIKQFFDLFDMNVIFKEFDESCDPLDFVISKNLHRRHLNSAQKAEIGLVLLEQERERGKEKKLATLKQFKKTDSGFEPETVESHDSYEIVARKVGISDKTLKQWKKITETVRDDEKIAKAKDKALQGDRSISGVFLEVIRKEKPKIIPKLPEGEFSVILADPPWKYAFERSPSNAVENHYPTMELEEIMNLKIPIAKDCIIFLWVTMPKLREGLKVLQSWGFEYKTGIIWVKTGLGLGYYVRGKHELILIGTKGKIGIPAPADRPKSVFFSPKAEHSKKPKELYEIIEKMYPNQKYLELFARETREGWESWGNEV